MQIAREKVSDKNRIRNQNHRENHSGGIQVVR
jgi:hypothetical protein